MAHDLVLPRNLGELLESPELVGWIQLFVSLEPALPLDLVGHSHRRLQARVGLISCARSRKDRCDPPRRISRTTPGPPQCDTQS